MGAFAGFLRPFCSQNCPVFLLIIRICLCRMWKPWLHSKSGWELTISSRIIIGWDQKKTIPGKELPLIVGTHGWNDQKSKTGGWFGTIRWEFDHPNWLNHNFRRGWAQPPTRKKWQTTQQPFGQFFLRSARWSRPLWSLKQLRIFHHHFFIYGVPFEGDVFFVQ